MESAARQRPSSNNICLKDDKIRMENQKMAPDLNWKVLKYGLKKKVK